MILHVFFCQTPLLENRLLMQEYVSPLNNRLVMQKAQQIVVGPSILSADFGDLAKDCQEVLDLGANSLHIDVMDGHFVPNLTVGPPVVKSLRKHLPTAHFDCHMNVTDPRNYVEQMAKIGINCFTFHLETEQTNPKELCENIKKNNMEVGIALSPKTPVDSVLEELIQAGLVYKVLIMTVEPGFGGQKFMPDMMDKVSYLKKKFPALNIQVDGGIGPDNAELVATSGANCLVAGSAIFCAKDRSKAINDILNAASKGQQECLKNL